MMEHAKQIFADKTLKTPHSREPSANHPAIIFLKKRRMVEPDGIEPTTSCLQSTRSPN